MFLKNVPIILYDACFYKVHIFNYTMVYGNYLHQTEKRNFTLSFDPLTITSIDETFLHDFLKRILHKNDKVIQTNYVFLTWEFTKFSCQKCTMETVNWSYSTLQIIEKTSGRITSIEMYIIINNMYALFIKPKKWKKITIDLRIMFDDVIE